ncbi:hypothetical protein G7Y79_00029g063440 [Physcia stellaris]|nr:hypothetical protein G7Y79_00029g063440 [Physcia stellaris]
MRTPLFFLSFLLPVLSLPSPTPQHLHQVPQNATLVPAARIPPLKTWHPPPFRVPIPSIPSATLSFVRVTGTNTQLDKRELLDLLDAQIDLLLSLSPPQGPSTIAATTRSGRYFFNCWAKTGRSVPVWSTALALGALRTFERMVRGDGVREVTFGVRDGEALRAVCVTVLK